MTLGLALTDAEVFVDGDWVESEDQDPNGDVRLIQLADVGDGCYVNKSARFLTKKKAEELRCTFLKPGDVLVARMPDPLGRACIFPGDAKAAVTVVDVCVIRPNARHHDARWLMHCLNSSKSRRQMAALATGTTRSRISRGNLKTIKVEVPPLDEQRRIAEVLDRAEALRAKRRAALAQLDTLTQSIFLDLFGDPASNPRGWPTRSLGSLCPPGDSINYGVVQPGDHVDDGIPVVRVGDLKDGVVNHAALKRISPAIESSYKRSRLVGDEILVSCVGSIGVVALADASVKGFNIARAVARVRIAEGCNRIFAAEALKTASVQQYFTQELRTVSQPTLNIKQISEAMVPVPPLPLQGDFAQRVAAVERVKSAQRRSLAELDALFASLQHRAFRGEL